MNNTAHQPNHFNLKSKRLIKFALFCGLFILFMYIYSMFDRRTVDNHKPFHDSMVVVVFQQDGSFLALPYRYIQQHSIANSSFLAKAPSGEKEKNGNETVSYKIVQQNNNQQIIETKLRTQSQITVAKYTATTSTVTPIESRVYNLQFIIMATLSALIIILLIQLLLKWKIQRNHRHKQT